MSLDIKRSITKYLKDNLVLYFIVVLFLVIGLFTGVLTVNSIRLSERQELLSYINNFFAQISVRQISNFAVFRQSLINNFQIVFALWVLGITIVGIPIILIIISLKGFIVGFTIGFIIKEMGFKGIIFTILSIIPQNILILPGIIIVGAMGVNFSIRILKNKAFKKGFFREIAYYSLEILTVSTLVLVGALVEGYIIPFIIKVFSNYV